MQQTTIGNYTLEIFEDETYCPIMHEYEPIIRFQLLTTYDGDNDRIVMLENESINLEILLIERDNLADKCFDLSGHVEIYKRSVEKFGVNSPFGKKLDYSIIRYLYFSFMLHYVKGMLSYDC